MNTAANSMSTRTVSWLYNAKNVLLFLIPISLSLYTISIFASLSGMEIFAWSTAALTLIYILIDRFGEPREFHFFGLSVDFPLLFLVIISAIGLMSNIANPDVGLVDELGGLRWIVLLYFLAYSFRILPSLNRSLNILFISAFVVSLYAIVQHFTGLDLLQLAGLTSSSAVHPAVGNADTFVSVGFFGQPLAIGFQLSMLIGFPFAALLLGQRKTSLFRWSMIILIFIIGLAVVWTYGHSAWIAALAGLITVAGFVGRRYVLIFGILAALGIFGAYKMSPEFHEHVSTIFSDPDMNASDRRDLWHANLKMFDDNPWIGIGLGRNEFRLPEYYEKLKVTESSVGAPIRSEAHNTYFQWLATTGFLGFACYMIFILLALLMTLRLWNEVPQTHYWHRVFLLGSLAAQVAACAGGLTQWNLGMPEVNHLFIFILAWTLYFGHRYGKDIVPDDFAL